MPNRLTKMREAVGKVLLAPQLARIREQFTVMQNAYYAGPWELPPQQLAQQLFKNISEYDSQLVYDLLEQMQYELVGAVGFAGDSGSERARAVQESRRAWKYDPLGQWIIKLWTDYGFGENITITPSAKKRPSGETTPEPESEPIPLSVTVFNEFWTAPRNAPVLRQDKIQQRSIWTLVDGQEFWAYFSSGIDGETTMRTIAPEEIKRVITSPHDDLVPWFYERTFIPKMASIAGTAAPASRTLYYPDWQLFFREKETDIMVDDAAKLVGIKPEDRADLQTVNGAVLEQQETRTHVVMQHLAHNQKESRELWGWPLLAPAGAPWLRAHRDFRQDRAAVAATAAMFAQRIKHKGGSRAGAAIRSQMQSALTQTGQYIETNPPPTAGATFIENDAAKLDKLHNIGTAAGDAKEDGEALAWMGLLSGGVFPHFAGIDAHLFTRQGMEAPLLRQWSRYQLFWSAQFRAMVEIVLRFHELGTGGRVKFETYDSEVSTDQLVETDLEQVTDSAKQFLDVLVSLQNRNLVSANSVTLIAAAISRVILQGYGVADGNKIASDEAMEPKEEAGAAEGTPEQSSPPPEEEEDTQEAQVAGKLQESEIAAMVKQNAVDGSAAVLDVMQWAVGQVMEEGSEDGVDPGNEGTA